MKRENERNKLEKWRNEVKKRMKNNNEKRLTMFSFFFLFLHFIFFLIFFSFIIIFAVLLKESIERNKSNNWRWKYLWKKRKKEGNIFRKKHFLYRFIFIFFFHNILNIRCCAVYSYLLERRHTKKITDENIILDR